MSDATFLLLINLAIGVSFALAFLALSWRSPQTLGRLCAAAFLCAGATVAIEALARPLGSVRLVSSLSYGSLMAALVLIASGLARHYGRKGLANPLWVFGCIATLFNAIVGVELQRGTWLASLTYQWPFAAMLMAATFIVMRHSPRRPVDIALGVVLGLSALQFLAKGALISLYGADVGVNAYLGSVYARYSQTAGSILSLMLGVTLLWLVASEVMAETIRHLERDGLSNALSRAAFLNHAPRLLARATPDAPVAAVMCDLDHFKSINDSHGHAAGDDVIRDVAGILIGLGGRESVCGRVGGDEFCLVLADAGPDRLARLDPHIAKAVASLAYDWLPADRLITVSLGIAVFQDRVDLATAMKRADIALYRAKSEGRGRANLDGTSI